jgi:hypothetical protein
MLLVVLGSAPSLAGAAWKPADNPLYTPWASDVGPDNALPEYPRPQMVRQDWLNLNGLWGYALEPVAFQPVQGLIEAKTMTTGSIPRQWQDKILVPFAIDSALSGVKHILRPTERVWYRRTFAIPSSWAGKRVLLHFQACDWETSVYLNGRRLGQHRGGYDPFYLDVTDALKAGDNELAVCAWDATEQQCQAIGKQIMPENRKGFRYQPTGGIWQTVWLEPVAEISIRRLMLTPDVEGKRLLVEVEGKGLRGCTVQAQVSKAGAWVSSGMGMPGARGDRAALSVPVPDARLWTPDDPFLYDLAVSVVKGGQVEDEVASYFGMRHVEVKKAADGFQRIHLNGKPIFQVGPLDQGYWPDGVLTPPTEEAIKFDLEYLKKIGCNMVRVHIKTHPERWYYWCDKLGLLVWQDMICMPKYGQTVDERAAKQWKREFAAMMNWLHNHPSIIQWIVFNEGWSQHETPAYAEWVKQRDPSRLVTGASGWTDYDQGDIRDVHDYSFYAGVPLADYAPARARLLGEAGGHNCYVQGHLWYPDRTKEASVNFKNEAGRVTAGTVAELEDAYAFWVEGLRCLNGGAGCNGLVYTQITDVEHECNGWLTYDRKVSKVDPARLRAIHLNLHEPPALKPVIGGEGPWEYLVTEGPELSRKPRGRNADHSGPWAALDFDDADWEGGSMPFGAADGSAVTVATPVVGKCLYLRRPFTLDSAPGKPVLRVVSGRNCWIYLNGQFLRRVNIGPKDGDILVNYVPLRSEERQMFTTGRNVLAVVVPDMTGARVVDVGLQTMIER